MGTNRKKPFKLWKLYFQPVRESEHSRVFESEYVRLLNCFSEGGSWRAEIIQDEIRIRSLRWGSPSQALACLFSVLDHELVICQNVLSGRPQMDTRLVVQTFGAGTGCVPLYEPATAKFNIKQGVAMMEYSEAEKLKARDRLQKLQEVHTKIKVHDRRTPHQRKFA